MNYDMRKFYLRFFFPRKDNQQEMMCCLYKSNCHSFLWTILALLPKPFVMLV